MPEIIKNFRDYDLMPKEQKKLMFSPFVETMQKIVNQHQLTLPKSVDLISRIVVLEGSLFLEVHTAYHRGTLFEDESNILFNYRGFMMPSDGTCVLNKTAINNKSKENELGENTILTKTGIHELWHSVSVNTERKCGLFKRDDPTIYPASALINLDEGLTDFFTRKTLQLTRKNYFPEILFDTYRNKLSVAELLTQKIGESLLLRAYLTEEGFEIFSQTLDEEYGINALNRLLDIISRETYTENHLQDQTYLGTKKFLLGKN